MKLSACDRDLEVESNATFSKRIFFLGLFLILVRSAPVLQTNVSLSSPGAMRQDSHCVVKNYEDFTDNLYILVHV